MLYNGLVQIKHNVSKAWANIDVLLKQRHAVSRCAVGAPIQFPCFRLAAIPGRRKTRCGSEAVVWLMYGSNPLGWVSGALLIGAILLAWFVLHDFYMPLKLVLSIAYCALLSAAGFWM